MPTAMKNAMVSIMAQPVMPRGHPRLTYSSAYPAVAFIDHSSRMWNFRMQVPVRRQRSTGKVKP